MSSLSLHRIAGLTRWNVVLLSRNRLALLYAAVLPLLPLGLLFSGEPTPSVGAGAIVTMTMVVTLFPVYYNILSQFVSRRDELVLKRMRTGETRDAELLASLALPGTVVALVLSALAVPVTVAVGFDAPANALLYALIVVLAVIMFIAFAFWTAAWTKNAEAAQLTSMPIILLTSLGPLTATIPDMSEGLKSALSLTPGAALSDLVRAGWFGLDGSTAKDATLSFAETWGATAGPLAVIVAWTVLAVVLARRSLRWEPRT